MRPSATGLKLSKQARLSFSNSGAGVPACECRLTRRHGGLLHYLLRKTGSLNTNSTRLPYYLLGYFELNYSFRREATSFSCLWLSPSFWLGLLLLAQPSWRASLSWVPVLA